MSLMQLIKDYDRQTQEDFEDLNRELEELRDQNQKLLDQVVQGVQTSDRMKLDLILNGCLVHPNEQRERVTIDRKLAVRAVEAACALANVLHAQGRFKESGTMDKLYRELSDAILQPKKTGDDT